MDIDEKRVVRRYSDEAQPSDLPAILAVPLELSGVVLSKGSGYLRLVAPQLISLSVCLLLVPLVILLSAFAGWFVWQNIAVGWETPVYLQYGDGLPPYAEVSLPYLVSQQAYEIALHLSIPATESNFALGNFMTTLTLSTISNKTLTSIRRPAIALPARTSFWTSRPKVVDLVIPLITSFTPGTSRVMAKVELGRRDGWTSLGEGHGRELSVLTASLRGNIRLEGLRGLVTRFPLLSALTSAAIFLVICLLVLAAFFLPALAYIPESPSGEQIPPHSPEKQKKPKPRAVFSDNSDEDDKPFRSRRISRRNTSSSSNSRPRPPPSDVDIKTEASSTVIPDESVGSSTPLRRRRSRLSSQNLSDEDA